MFETLLNLEDLIDEIELEAGHDPVELPPEPLLGKRPFVPLARDLDPVSFPSMDLGRFGRSGDFDALQLGVLGH